MFYKMKAVNTSREKLIKKNNYNLRISINCLNFCCRCREIILFDIETINNIKKMKWKSIWKKEIDHDEIIRVRENRDVDISLDRNR